jgi:hypothetical protein
MTMQLTTVSYYDAEGNYLDEPREVPNTDRSNTQGNCERCGTLILRFRGQGDLQCSNCGANYNCCGQRLRDDLHTRVNYSEYDDDIDDLSGDEESWLRQEAYD